MNPERTLMFYCIGEVSTIDAKLDDLRKYIPDESRYLITHEIGSATKKPHFHVIAEMQVEEYKKYADAVLRKKYQLLGNKKEYGKVNKINDINKAISYILKDEGEKRTNLPAEELAEFLKNSFRKEEDKDHIELAIQSVPQLTFQYSYSDTDIVCAKIMILEYFKKNNLDCNIQKVGRIFNMYLMRHEKFSASQIYEIMRQDRNNRL